MIPKPIKMVTKKKVLRKKPLSSQGNLPMGLQPQVWAEWNANRTGRLNEKFTLHDEALMQVHTHALPDITPFANLFMTQLSEYLQGRFMSSRQQIGQLLSGETE